METSKPDPKLLSFLDKLVHPISRILYKFQINGVYAFPDEWKIADDANPTYFTYQAKLAQAEVLLGKIQPRQLTEKEIKDAEEAALAKKKPIKKDPKNEAPPPTAEELERLKKIQEELEEEEKRRQLEWDSLDEKTQFYRTHEDKYKHACIIN